MGASSWSLGSYLVPLRWMQAQRFPEVHHPSGLVAVQTIVNPLTPGKDVQRLVLCPEGRYRGRSQLGAMEPSPRPLALGNMAASAQQSMNRRVLDLGLNPGV